MGRYAGALVVPPVEQRGDLTQQKVVEVVHLREAVSRQALRSGRRNTRLGRPLHRRQYFVLVGVEDGPGVVA